MRSIEEEILDLVDGFGCALTLTKCVVGRDGSLNGQCDVGQLERHVVQSHFEGVSVGIAAGHVAQLDAQLEDLGEFGFVGWRAWVVRFQLFEVELHAAVQVLRQDETQQGVAFVLLFVEEAIPQLQHDLAEAIGVFLGLAGRQDNRHTLLPVRQFVVLGDFFVLPTDEVAHDVLEEEVGLLGEVATHCGLEGLLALRVGH